MGACHPLHERCILQIMPRFACSARLPDTLAARSLYALAAIGVVGFGLLWRSRLLPLPAFLMKYGGDALWAALVYLLIRFAGPALTTLRSAVLAFTVAALVEFAQLYHSPWIDAIRGTRLGALALGNTFNWPDIPAYALGITMAAFIDVWFRASLPSSSAATRGEIHS